ncbi:uncharacterized protein [Argopecten irradians]|uniref:uncharacterized protein n=1 Tax=Argopecten irradians TaxID=31199 RepID=UPI003715EA24
MFYVLVVILFGLSSDFADGTCNFPSTLTDGTWVSAEKGDLVLSGTSILSYPVLITGVSTFDFNCIDQSGTTFLFQAVEFQNVFGVITRFFLCLDIQEINGNVLKYFVGTEYDVFVKDFIFPLADAIAALAQACNRATPYEPQTYITLVKSGSVADGSAPIQCPDGLLAVFTSVAISGQTCANSVLDVCSNRTQMNFTMDTPCATELTFSAGGQYSCLHHVTSGQTTYLSLWNNDASPTYQFSCFAFEVVGDVVTATETIKYCTATTDHVTPGTRDTIVGKTIVAQDPSEKCVTLGATSCTFPERLKGVWITSDSTIFRINSTTLHGYPVNIPGYRTIDLTCEEVNQTKYKLRSIQQTLVFGLTVNMFLCMDIRPSQDNYLYYVGTDFESFLNDALLGSINSTVTFDEVCNRPEPYDVDSAVMLVKNASSVQGIPCPQSTRFMYRSLSVVNGTNITYCNRSQLDVCEDTTRMRIKINDTCGTALATTVEFSCLYYEESYNTTYLYMDTNDSNMMSLVDHNIICAELFNVSGGLVMTIYKEYCSDLMNTDPILFLRLSSAENCQSHLTDAATTPSSTLPADSSFTTYFIIGGVIVLCIAIGVIVMIIISRQKMCFQCRLQPQVPDSGQQFTDINL